jgi:hypothetical protein
MYRALELNPSAVQGRTRVRTKPPARLARIHWPRLLALIGILAMWPAIVWLVVQII